MISSKKVICIIPARLRSSRFPEKMLSYLQGKPLLQWVWEQAQSVRAFDQLAFAVDDARIATLVSSFGAPYYMTSLECSSGTERLAEVLRTQQLDADIWVNWQGDEPFITEGMIDTLLSTCDEEGDIWTLKKKITHPEEITSPQVAKIVCDAKGFALYFSRSTIPYYRDATCAQERVYYKHVGLYAFTRRALEQIGSLQPCAIECAEQLEQLRFLYHHLHIKVHETDQDVFGIDLPEHLARAEAVLAKRNKTLI